MNDAKCVKDELTADLKIGVEACRLDEELFRSMSRKWDNEPTSRDRIRRCTMDLVSTLPDDLFTMILDSLAAGAAERGAVFAAELARRKA